ncbi:hypothetical protein A4E84_19650 [Streptomyces qaidamensis]|uniref:Serine/threonine protein kinase n=1 Tax=Streptomyces qaidamensis TaxID=1783515 RepID=A0A143C2W9_9ACTN|nr:hypothetical protein [Streptomyces qaidamensis]AMW11510.1 hypothetical protein A4E84_19650 [Streptomyces qaidamensis]
MRRHARGRSRDPRKTRLFALAGVVAACAAALPLAVASAGSVGSTGSTGTVGSAGSKASVGSKSSVWATGSKGTVESVGADGRASESGAVRPSPRTVGKAPGASVPGRPLLGQGLSTAVRCGPGLSSPDGIEAQTCVVTQGAETWARTYYRNATGEPLDAVLSLMGPEDRSVRMTCAVRAEDEPGTCETPREPTHGNPAAYTAVAEFAERGGRGPLLLRSGSNSPGGKGS